MKKQVNIVSDELLFNGKEILTKDNISNYIDLSNYYTKAETNNVINNSNNNTNYYSKTEIDNKLNDCYTKTETNSTINSKLNDYYTKSNIDSIFSNYYTKSNVYTKTETDNKYSTKTEVDNKFASYYTKTETIDISHPVNSVYITTSSSNPNTIFGSSTVWTLLYSATVTDGSTSNTLYYWKRTS